MNGVKVWLDKLYYEVGYQFTNFKLCKTYKKEDEIYFSKWVSYLDAQSTSFIHYANQRTLLNNEIVLDLDYGNLTKLIEILKGLGLIFYVYKTGNNRSKHIHLYSKDLAFLKRFDRENQREIFIKKFNCDIALKSDNHMISIEYCKHWKTGEIKELVFKNE